MLDDALGVHRQICPLADVAPAWTTNAMNLVFHRFVVVGVLPMTKTALSRNKQE